MAMPNNLLVAISKSVLGPISVHNYIFYRQIGLFWIVASLLFLFWIMRSKNDFLNRVAVFHFIYAIFGSFVLFQEQYFGFYGFYLFCSLIVFYSIWVLDERYTSNRKYFYCLLLFSPILCFFLTWQMFWYILIKEFSVASKKTKIVFLIFLTTAALPILTFWKPLMALCLKHTIVDYSATSLTLRGFSLSLLVKPIYAMFQFIFGYDMEPTENVLVIGVFVIVILGFIYRLYRLISENSKQLKLLFFAAIIPFLGMYWLLEPITLPRATQFESKHGLFFLPFFLATFVPTQNVNKKKILSYFLPSIILFCLVWSTVVSFSSPRPDWKEIINLARDVQSKGGIILVDGRAKQNFLFYSNGKVNREKVFDIYEVADKQEVIRDTRSVLLVTNDWKSYQTLSLTQNWNTGAGTEDRFNAVSSIFENVRRTDRVCTGAYGFYPLFAFKYEANIMKAGVNQPKPGFFTIPYQDVRLPIQKDGVVVYGWYELKAGDRFALENTNPGEVVIYYFISCNRHAPEGIVVGRIESSNSSADLLLGNESSGIYSALYSRPLKQAETWFKWYKRPVITQSLRYRGSLWPSEGRIYRSKFSVGENANIIVSHPDMAINLCYIDYTDQQG